MQHPEPVSETSSQTRHLPGSQPKRRQAIRIGLPNRHKIPTVVNLVGVTVQLAEARDLLTRHGVAVNVVAGHRVVGGGTVEPIGAAGLFPSCDSSTNTDPVNGARRKGSRERTVKVVADKTAGGSPGDRTSGIAAQHRELVDQARHSPSART